MHSDKIKVKASTATLIRLYISPSWHTHAFWIQRRSSPFQKICRRAMWCMLASKQASVSTHHGLDPCVTFYQLNAYGGLIYYQHMAVAVRHGEIESWANASEMITKHLTQQTMNIHSWCGVSLQAWRRLRSWMQIPMTGLRIYRCDINVLLATTWAASMCNNPRRAWSFQVPN